MILFNSDGRLGNQLFQYAFLNTIRRNNEYILTTNMQILLDSFEINDSKIINIPLSRITNFLQKNIANRFMPIMGKIRAISYIEETINYNQQEYIFSNGLLPITYIKTGFFQSESFFNEKKINFRQNNESLLKASSIIARLPADTEKVFIHVRRGDYLNECFRGKKNISLPKYYYLKAMEIIEKDVINPFYIFLTDDYDFVEETYKNIENKYISQESMLVDLAIMSKCKYGVVSNSSFSWWGAYLAKNRKAMIFPKYWYGWKDRFESHNGIQPEWGIIIDPNS